LNFSGAVSTPSTVDVYVNGQLLRRVPLPPGQFELKDLPVPAGTNNTRLVLRDAFGREREIGSQYYFASGLLKEGLHEFSYNFVGRLFNAGGFIKLLSPHYATTILKARDDRSWMELNAFVGFPLTSRLGVSLRYTFEDSNVDGQRHGIALSTTTRLTDRVSL